VNGEGVRKQSPGRYRLELAVFLAVAAFTYLSMARILRDVNPWARMAPVFAVVEHGVLNIDPYVANTIDWARHGGHYYSNKAPGPMILALPVYFAQHVAQRALGVPDDAPLARDVALYASNAVATIAPTLLALALMWRVLVEKLDLSPALGFLLVGTWAFASLSLPYTIVFMGHQTAGAFLAVAVCGLLLGEDRAGGARPVHLAAAGAAAGFAAISDWLSAALVAVWTAYLAWRNPRGLLPWLAGAAGPVVVALAYNAACFGSPFTTGYDLALLNPEFVPIARWEAPSLARLADITVNPWRGLFYATPVFIMIFVGLERLREEARRHPAILAAAAGVVLYFTLLAAYPSAFGGACLGPRYFTAALPLCILLMAPAARILPRLLVALSALSAVMMLSATLVDPLPDQSIQDPFRDHIFPNLASADPVPMRNVFSGLLGVSRLVAFGAYLGLWGACAVWLWLRLRERASAAQAELPREASP